MDPLGHLTITRADPGGPSVLPLIHAHLAYSHATTPKDSNHALNVTALQAPDIRFWCVADAGTVVGCGALKALPSRLAEVKSVHVVSAARGRGIAQALMRHLVDVARRDGTRALVLETGSGPDFAPARRLYERLGFTHCGPIPGYVADPHSAFLHPALGPAAENAQDPPTRSSGCGD